MPIINPKGGRQMLIWIILGGYVAAAVAFYTYIVATAQEEPQEDTGVIIDLVEWKRRRESERQRDTEVRRAA